MLLHLSCKGYGIGLDLPATPDVVVDRLSKLRGGHRPTTPVQISGVGDPFSAVVTGKFSFPESTRPYLDYAKIGAEQRDALGGVYTPLGLVKRRKETPVQTETLRTMLLTLKTSEQSCPLVLPASEEQMSHAKRRLGIEDFSQAVIASVEYTAPYLDRLIPTDCITVEHANELADCLQRLGVTKDEIAAVDLMIRHDGREWLSGDCLKMGSFKDDPVVAEAVVKLRRMLEAAPVVGRVTFASGEEAVFTDPEKYLQTVRDELPYHATTGFRCETLTDDPAVRKAVDDMLCDLYGEENPRSLADYGNKGMAIGGLNQ